MHKKLKITFYILAGVIIIYYLINATGICAFYHMPTTGSEPNLKRGSFTIASNLITPKRGDFIVYDFNDSIYGEVVQIHRLCGMENDTIQITKGELFVNEKSFDENYNLQHAYLLDEATFKSLYDPNIEHFLINTVEGNKGYLTFVEDVDAKTYKLAEKRYRTLKTISNPDIKKMYQQDWNKDHFGPIVVPKGKLFVLGDNRDNSRDSRFFGFIDASSVKGVYWKTLFRINSK